MKVSDEILAKAMSIKNDKKRLKICLKAGICPICGEPLKKSIVFYSIDYDVLTKCSANKTHYYSWD